jgi:hypothetical protein
MIAKLRDWSYCPILDEILRYYTCFFDKEEPLKSKSILVARKYLERTRYSDEEIINKIRVRLRSCDFEFHGMKTEREKNFFVKYFETFLNHMVRVIGYINGTVYNLYE